MINNNLRKTLLVAGIAGVLVFSAAACKNGGGSSSSAAKSSAASFAAAVSSAAPAPASSAAPAPASSAAPAPASSAAPAPASSAAPAPASQTSDLSSAEFANLMQQVANNQMQKRYVKFVGDANDGLFATAEVYGIDRTGNTGKMYARLYDSEYISFKGKAYDMQGSSGDVIIEFDYAANGPALKQVIWSADAAAYNKWMQDNYPAKYLQKAQAYNPTNSNGQNVLQLALASEVSLKLGVPVEPSDQLTINDDGTYEVVRVKESGTTAADYKFETEVIDSGKF